MSNDLAGFLGLVRQLTGSSSLVPEADAEDARNGATYIPGEVTEARRSGKVVKFVRGRPKAQWYWKMPDGTKITYSP